jgi:hypothetical protein
MPYELQATSQYSKGGYLLIRVTKTIFPKLWSLNVICEDEISKHGVDEAEGYWKTTTIPDQTTTITCTH